MDKQIATVSWDDQNILVSPGINKAKPPNLKRFFC